MPYYKYEDNLTHFNQIIKGNPSREDIEEGQVELNIDAYPVVISKGKKGCLMMEICLGLVLNPLPEERLKQLAASNFLGINTGGCMIAFDETGASLLLRCVTSTGTSPHENWEWLHRLLCVAREWNKVLSLWEEFIPLVPSEMLERNEKKPFFRV